MYVYNWAIYVKQVIPPHWRGTYRETVLKSLLVPLEVIYRKFINYRRANQGIMNINVQTASLTWHLNAKFAEPGLRGIEVINRYDEEGEVPGEIEIHIAQMFYDRKDVILQLREEVKKHLPLGITFTVKKKNNIF